MFIYRKMYLFIITALLFNSTSFKGAIPSGILLAKDFSNALCFSCNKKHFGCSSGLLSHIRQVHLKKNYAPLVCCFCNKSQGTSFYKALEHMEEHLHEKETCFPTTCDLSPISTLQRTTHPELFLSFIQNDDALHLLYSRFIIAPLVTTPLPKKPLSEKCGFFIPSIEDVILENLYH